MTAIPKWEEAILKELLSEKETCGVFDLTFAPTADMTKEQVEALKVYLKERFELWFDSWIGEKAERILNHGKAT